MPRGEAMLSTRLTPYGYSHVRSGRLISRALKLSPVDICAIVEVFEILRGWRDEARR